MANMTEQSVGPLALDAIWLDEATQASSSGYGVADLFSWDEEVGADFAAEVESVSRLFPHLDGLPSELSGDGAPAVARQAAVCGGTRVALGADPGSPADALASPGDQCLMSPSDALLASPDPSLAASPLAPSPYGADTGSAGDWKVATSRRARSESVHIPAENTVTDDITTLIEFVEPARAASKRPPSEEEIFVSPADLEMPTTSKHTDTTSAAPLPDESSCTSAAGSPEQEAQEEEELSPEVAEFLLSAAHAQQEDEHTRMIDQALLDLKTLETLCGIGSDSQQPAAGVDSAAIAADLLSAVTEPAAAPTARPAVAASAVKQEPAPQADEEEDIEIVEERPAPRRRRRRPPRVAVTPPSAAAASPATQIVIVLTSEQLANIQQSGQLVLSAAALQPGLATAQPRGRAHTSTRTATVLKRTGAATATSTSGVTKTTSTNTSGVTKTTSTNTKTAGTSVTKTAGTSTSAAGTSSTRAVKRPRVIVKQETPAKRARTAQSTATGTEDPLSGWMEQKFPPSAAGWDVPLLPAGVGEVPLAGDEEEAASGCIPEDLQDVLLDGTDAGAVPSLPAEAADCLLEELISGSVRENPGLFDGAPPHDVLVKPQPQPPLQQQPQPLLGELQPPPTQQQLQAPASPPLQLLAPGPVAFTLSPQPQQQLTLEPWAAALCHSPGEQPSSPSSECCSPELAPAPDWQPGPAARRGARRPRPYDKTPGSAGRGAGAARRQPLTEEERRERKKEQNKNAATRYRQKKKEEHDLVSGDQEMLEARNKVLRDRVGALSRELNYLKQLMREVLRHKQVTA